MKVQEHMSLLGKVVIDKVTGCKGVVSTVSFDLYGCIQAVVVPPADDKGKREAPAWFDVQRLTVVSKKPVMAVPNFEFGTIAEGRKGPAEKPQRNW